MTWAGEIVGHRGAAGLAPENTLAAFDEALVQGCDAIELDLQLSRDEIPVVYHDRTLIRTGGGRVRVGSPHIARPRVDSSRIGAGSGRATAALASIFVASAARACSQDEESNQPEADRLRNPSRRKALETTG